jgi:hypothetical protein
VLTTPGVEHASAQALPSPRAVQRVMTAPVGLARVPGAAAASAARQQAADGAELHALRLVTVPALTLVTLGCMPVAIATSVMWRGAGVYPPAVLRLQAQQSRSISVSRQPPAQRRLHRIAITEVASASSRRRTSSLVARSMTRSSGHPRSPPRTQRRGLPAAVGRSSQPRRGRSFLASGHSLIWEPRVRVTSSKPSRAGRAHGLFCESE